MITYHTMLSVAYSNQKFCSLAIATEKHTKSILLGIKSLFLCVVKNTKSGSGLGPPATGIKTSVLRNCVGLPGGCVWCHGRTSSLSWGCWHKWHHSWPHLGGRFWSRKSLCAYVCVCVLSKCSLLLATMQVYYLSFPYLVVEWQESLSPEPVSFWTALLHMVCQL